MRDALLVGGVIAASAVTALIALDRGPGPRPHFGFGISAPESSDTVTATSRLAKSSVATHARHAAPVASALPKQIGFGPPKRTNNPADAPVVMIRRLRRAAGPIS